MRASTLSQNKEKQKAPFKKIRVVIGYLRIVELIVLISENRKKVLLKNMLS